MAIKVIALLIIMIFLLGCATQKPTFNLNQGETIDFNPLSLLVLKEWNKRNFTVESFTLDGCNTATRIDSFTWSVPLKDCQDGIYRRGKSNRGKNGQCFSGVGGEMREGENKMKYADGTDIISFRDGIEKGKRLGRINAIREMIAFVETEIGCYADAKSSSMDLMFLREQFKKMLKSEHFPSTPLRSKAGEKK